MKTFSYTIKDEVGIHARPAGNLAKLAKGFEGTKVTIEKGGKSVDVTKLMMLMGLGAKCGDTVNFTVEGPDEDAAAAAVLDFMTNNL
ncbi:MAG: HPr family phosphocarrier protein [Ruminococcaceae bacterium]|nr:HPr family phosphocarrier protein [Oscillospiraceae bacterium]